MATFVYPTISQIAQAQLNANEYESATVNLMLANPGLSPNLTLAECIAQIATFTGYADQVYSGTPAVPYVDNVRGGVSFTLPTVNFAVGSAPTTGNDIHGLYVTKAGSGGILLFALIFAAPIPMQVFGDQANIEMTINEFGDGSISCTVNGVPV